jgi:hypothetical protein
LWFLLEAAEKFTIKQFLKINQKWDYTKTIEEMGDRELNKRIKDAMNYEIKNKIRAISYFGAEKLTIEYSYPELQARCAP